MAQVNARLAVNGHYYVVLPLTMVLSAEELAANLWAGRNREEFTNWTPEVKMTAKRVREAVKTAAVRHGNGYLIENDDEYTQEGGQEWALAIVRRVYKFPEEG